VICKYGEKALNVSIKLVCDLQTQVGNEKFLSNLDLVRWRSWLVGFVM